MTGGGGGWRGSHDMGGGVERNMQRWRGRHDGGGGGGEGDMMEGGGGWRGRHDGGGGGVERET